MQDMDIVSFFLTKSQTILQYLTILLACKFLRQLIECNPRYLSAKYINMIREH